MHSFNRNTGSASCGYNRVSTLPHALSITLVINWALTYPFCSVQFICCLSTAFQGVALVSISCAGPRPNPQPPTKNARARQYCCCCQQRVVLTSTDDGAFKMIPLFQHLAEINRVVAANRLIKNVCHSRSGEETSPFGYPNTTLP